MKKHLLNHSLISLLLITISFNLQAQTVTVNNITAFINSDFKVNINTSELLSSDNIASFEFKINYDPTILEYINFEKENTLSENCEILVDNTEPGTLLVLGASSTPRIEGAGSLLKVVFRGKAVGMSYLNLSDFVYNMDIIPSLNNGFANIYSNKTVTVDNITTVIDNDFILNINTSEILESENIISIQFILNYDENIIEYIEEEITNTFTENSTYVINSTTPGILNIAIACNPPGPFIGSGSILGFKFKGITSGLSSVTISDFYFNTTPITNTVDGSATIIPSPSITVTDANANVNDNFELSINTTELLVSDNTVTYQFQLDYDETLIEYTGYNQTGTLLENDKMIEINSSVPGTLIVGCISLGDVFSGSGSLINLEFNSLACGSSTVSISDFKYNDNIVTDLSNGTVSADFSSTISIANTNVTVGDNFSTPVSINSIPISCGANTFQTTIQFDETQIEYQGIDLTGSLDPATIINIDNNTPGVLTIDGTFSTTISGSGDILSLEFNAIGGTNSTIQINQFSFDGLPMSDLVNGQVVVTTINGSVDNNPDVTLMDAFLVMLYSVGGDTEPFGITMPWEAWRVAAADVNGDGTLNSVDATLIMQYTLGIITEFPGGKKSTLPEANIKITKSGNELVFKPVGSVYSLDIISISNYIENSIGEPINNNENWLIATNIYGKTYKAATAAARPLEGESEILRIPIIDDTKEVIFNTLVNGHSKTVVWKNGLTGTTEIENSNIFKVFPNPVADQLKLELSLNASQNIIIKIYEYSGKLIQELSKKNLPVGTYLERIDVSNLPNGNYLIKVVGEDIKLSKTFIKK